MINNKTKQHQSSQVKDFIKTTSNDWEIKNENLINDNVTFCLSDV